MINKHGIKIVAGRKAAIIVFHNIALRNKLSVWQFIKLNMKKDALLSQRKQGEKRKKEKKNTAKGE